MITKAKAYLLKCASRGVEAKFDEEFAAESDRVIETDWVRHLMLGWSWALEVQQQVRGEYDDHRVPDDDGPIVLGPRGLCLRGAVIVGKLDLSGCGSAHEPLPSLSCIACRFESTQGTTPSIDLSNAHICSLKLIGSQLTHLRAVGMCVTGSVDLSGVRPAEHAAAPLCWCNLSGCFCGGHLLVDAAEMHAPAHESASDELSPYDFFELKWAFNLSASQIAGSVMMRKRPIFHGGVVMDFSRVQGDLRISGASIMPYSADSPAIALERVRIDGSLTLTGDGSDTAGSLRCQGPIWLYQAEIGGSLDIHGASLDGGRSGVALYAQGLTVRNWFTIGQRNSPVVASGRLWLQHSQIDGSLILAFVKAMNISLLSSYYNAQLSESTNKIVLNAYSIHVQNTVRLSSNEFDGGIDFSDARCTTLVDDPSGYNGASPIIIDGFRYERLDSDSFLPQDRLKLWLPSGVAYRPHPYVQLAHVLAGHGQEALARSVLIRKATLDAKRRWHDVLNDGVDTAKKNAASRALTLTGRLLQIIWGCLNYHVFSRIYRTFFDFGLSPGKAAATLLGSILIGIAMFSLIEYRGCMIVAQTPVASLVRDVEGELKFVAITDEPLSGHFALDTDIPCGRSIRLPVYAADVFIPLVDLREEGKCDIDKASGSTASQWEITAYRLLKAIYAVVGWVVTTLALLTFSGVMRHRLAQD